MELQGGGTAHLGSPLRGFAGRRSCFRCSCCCLVYLTTCMLSECFGQHPHVVAAAAAAVGLAELSELLATIKA